ncbi:MAG: hypothetical protein Q7R79_00615, partial [bacterium]|nr:hypothetical protein [bacterium]
QVILQNVKPGESRIVEARWLGDVLSADEVDVRPNVDVMDPQTFFIQPAGIQRHFNSENQQR